MTDFINSSQSNTDISEDHLRLVLDQTLIATTISRLSDGQLLYINPVAARKYDLKKEELPDKTFRDYWVDNAEREKFVSELQKNGRIFDREIEIRDPESDSPAWYVVSASLLEFDGEKALMSSHFDVTSRKKADAELKASDARLRAVLESSPAAVALKDDAGTFVTANRTWHSWFNPEGRSITNLKTDQIFTSPRAERIIATDKRITESLDGVDMEIDTDLEDGRKFPTHVQKFPYFDDDRNFLGIATFMTNVSERKRIEKDLLAARDIALEADRAKSRFLANMSHELRTPMNAILGYTEALKMGIKGQLTEDQLEYTDAVYKSGEHLIALINDILDLSKIEAGEARLDEGCFTVSDLIGYALKNVATEAGRDISITNLASDSSIVLRVDRRRVSQMLINLLSNAVKFSHRSGEVKITSEMMPNSDLRISICDDGIGMNEDDMLKALTEFGQAHEALDDRPQGTGLGLPMVRSLIEMHGGRLEMTSAPQSGTTASLFFPARRITTEAGRTVP